MSGGDTSIRFRPAEHEERWRELSWSLIPQTPCEPLMNMALDEVLTLRVASGARPPTVRIWGWSDPCVVLGRFQSVRNEVDEVAAAANGVQIVRRISGGGAMFIEPEGAITYSIYAPESLAKGMSFGDSYQFFDSWVIDALQAIGVDAWYEPLNDITSSGGKIGGAAQARRGGAILHHTTMAYQMNVEAMLQVLRIGQEKLSDKGIQSAAKRVGPLRQQTDLPRDELIERLVGHFDRSYGLSELDVTQDELDEAHELVESRFSTRAWTHFLP